MNKFVLSNDILALSSVTVCALIMMTANAICFHLSDKQLTENN